MIGLSCGLGYFNFQESWKLINSLFVQINRDFWVRNVSATDSTLVYVFLSRWSRWWLVRRAKGREGAAGVGGGRGRGGGGSGGPTENRETLDQSPYHQTSWRVIYMHILFSRKIKCKLNQNWLDRFFSSLLEFTLRRLISVTKRKKTKRKGMVQYIHTYDMLWSQSTYLPT